ncbi:ECF transporter S component [Rhodoluna sp.]|uniref:ECF transporter S component n=1 Tax=Rhodoluna sp. TaxID=1969481 RepID=UPI0025F4A3BB|nr:ECF transporter S component [Rhodoluna sp.]
MKTSALSKVIIGAAGLTSLLMFTWPLFIGSTAANEAVVAQTAFILLMPMILVLILVEFATGGIDSRHLAILGVLTALNAVVRMLGAGTAGVETAFFIIIISASVFGSGFGFLLGTTSLLVSALLSGGVGPWLPFQMMAAGLIGLGAGFIPKPKRRWLLLTALIGYATISSFIYGGLMTMWNWPFLAGIGSSVSYAAGEGVGANILRFINYELLTGGLIWDLGRAITTSVLILVTAPALLATLNRAANRAGFEKL